MKIKAHPCTRAGQPERVGVLQSRQATHTKESEQPGTDGAGPGAAGGPPGARRRGGAGCDALVYCHVVRSRFTM